MWYIYTMEYYSAIKKNKILIYATIQMNLKNIMLRVRRQNKRPYMILFVWNFQKRKNYKTKTE